VTRRRACRSAGRPVCLACGERCCAFSCGRRPAGNEHQSSTRAPPSRFCCKDRTSAGCRCLINPSKYSVIDSSACTGRAMLVLAVQLFLWGLVFVWLEHWQGWLSCCCGVGLNVLQFVHRIVVGKVRASQEGSELPCRSTSPQFETIYKQPAAVVSRCQLVFARKVSLRYLTLACTTHCKQRFCGARLLCLAAQRLQIPVQLSNSMFTTKCFY